MVTYFVLKKFKNCYLGSVLAGSTIKVMNAYGWGVQFRKKSLQNLIVEYFGVFHLGARVRNRILSNILEKENHKNHRLFDAGCGVGLISLHLSSKFHKISGVDIDSQKIKDANILLKSNNVKNVEFSKADLLKDNFTNKKFDVIICFEVLEHVVDDKKLLSNLGHLLEEDGQLILSFPSGTFLSRIAQKSLDHYKIGYTPTDIKKLLQGTDLKIVDEYSFGKSVLGKGVVACDFVFRKTFPFLASIFFPVFYPLMILDYHLPKFGIPRGYVLIIRKKIILNKKVLI